MSDLKQTIIALSIRANSGDKQADRELDKLLASTSNVDRFKLFINRISNKECVQTLRGLINGLEVTDYNVSLALSSLLTQSLLELGNDVTLYGALRIKDQIALLNDFINGKCDTKHIIDCYKHYLI